MHAGVEYGAVQEGAATGGSYLYEPDETDLLNALVPKHFQIQAYRVLLESAAAEHGARMAAMDGGERNAGQQSKGDALLQQDKTGGDYERTHGYRRRCRSPELAGDVNEGDSCEHRQSHASHRTGRGCGISSGPTAEHIQCVEGNAGGK